MVSTRSTRSNYSFINAVRRTRPSYQSGSSRDDFERRQTLRQSVHAPRRPGEHPASSPIVHGGLDARTIMGRLASAQKRVASQRQAVCAFRNRRQQAAQGRTCMQAHPASVPRGCA